MNWVWAAFCAFWTAGVLALGLHAWRAPLKWQQQGYVDNGIGTRIDFQNVRARRLLTFSSRAFAFLAFLMAAAGVVGTLAWIGRAI